MKNGPQHVKPDFWHSEGTDQPRTELFKTNEVVKLLTMIKYGIHANIFTDKIGIAFHIFSAKIQRIRYCTY